MIRNNNRQKKKVEEKKRHTVMGGKRDGSRGSERTKVWLMRRELR